MISRERLRAALANCQPGRQQIPEFSPSAVLVPIVERDGDPALLFTVRPMDMPTHGGQVAFPGGRRSPEDVDIHATALRESREEIGLAPDQVEVLGELDEEITPFGFVITPVVGWLKSLPTLQPNPREVESTFEVSLARLADPAIFVDAGAREFRGRIYTLPEYHVEGHVIWGATARIAQGLLARVK